MSSLTTCIKKAGKALSKADADSIRAIAADLGDPQAAVDEYLATLAEERTELTTRIEDAGGQVETENVSVSRFALYHGTPHKFSKFELEKIGTGTGTQTEGYGLYFAERPGVAKNFTGVDNSGHLYEVDIPDETIAKMLDWDAPLSEQPEAKEAFRRAFKNRLINGTEIQKSHADYALRVMMNRSHTHGGTFYHQLAAGDQEGASKLLNEVGLPGIRYYDSASRGTQGKALPQVTVNGRKEYESVVERVAVDDLLAMRGNRLGKTDLSKLKQEITEAGGLKEPIIIQVGKNDRTAVVGEGNHRVQAAKELGYDYVPARVLVQRETYTPIPGRKRNDLIPEANEYFKADAKPSEVLKDITVYSPGTRNIVVFNPDDITQVKRDGEIVYEQNKESEPDIRFQIEDDFVERLVDEQPTHPISQVSKIGALVEKIGERTTAPDIIKLWDKTKDITRDAWLAALPQSKLNEVFRGEMRGVDRLVDLVKRMDADINTGLEDLAETANAWKKLIRKGKKDADLLGLVMHWTSLKQVDPSKPFELPKSFAKMNRQQKRIWMDRKHAHGVLQEKWDQLSDDAKKIYNDVREDYATLRSNTLEELEKRIMAAEADNMQKTELIARLRKEFEKGRIDPYFPLARFGKHWATAKDADGKVVAFIKRESRTERNLWVKEMRAAGYRAFASEEKPSSFEAVKGIDSGFAARVVELTKGMTVKSEDGKSVINIADEIWQMYLRSLPEMSSRKAFIHRQGRLGFTGDALRAYGYHMFHGTHQLGKLRYGFQMESELDSIKQEAALLTKRLDDIENLMKDKGLEAVHDWAMLSFPRYKKIFNAFKGTEEERMQKAVDKFKQLAEAEGPWAQPLAKEMELRHQYTMNPQSSLWSTRMTSMGFFWFLSTSPAAGMLNLTQTAIVGLPVLGARFNYAGAAGELLKASGQLVSTTGEFVNKLRGDERASFEQWEREGGSSKTRVRDLTGYAERGEDYTDRTQGAVDLASWIFHKTEKWNREVTFIAAYRLARKAGRSAEAARMEAAKLVEMSHFDYTNTNRPRFMQKDLARVIFLFRNYSLNMTYRLLKDFRDGVMRNPNVETEVRNEAAKRLTGILGMTFMFAGMSGMPLLYAFHSIADAILGDDDEPYDSQAAFRAYLTDIWGEDAATFITHGAWDTLTGTTLSTRASLNNLWIREIPDSLSGEDLFKHMLLEAAGPMAGIGANFARGIENISQGYVERGIEKMVPKFVADTMKTIRYATEGALSHDKSDALMKPEEFSGRDLFAQWSGFVPTKLTTRYEQQRAIKDYDKALTRRRKYLMDRLFMAARNDDRKEIADTMKLIGKWNQKNPREAINGKGIQQSAKARADHDMRNIMGTTVSKKRHYLHEMFRMTDKDEEK